MGKVLLLPLRLLVFLVRLPIVLLDLLIYLLYTVILYVVAIPGFVIHALYQLARYPFRRRGETRPDRFRVRWFLAGPIQMYLEKQREILSWLWASWRVFGSRKQREANRIRLRQRYQTYFQREEPTLNVQQTAPRRRRRSTAGKNVLPDIPVFGEQPDLAHDRASQAAMITLPCPHCGEAGEDYVAQHEQAVVYQFVQHPGGQYAGADTVRRCVLCGEVSYIVEVLKNKGVYNLKTQQWEAEPAWRSRPVRKIAMTGPGGAT